MAVIINEFEAVAESSGEARSATSAPKKPHRITPAELRNASWLLAVRAARVRAH